MNPSPKTPETAAKQGEPEKMDTTVREDKLDTTVREDKMDTTLQGDKILLFLFAIFSCAKRIYIPYVLNLNLNLKSFIYLFRSYPT